MNVIKSLGTKTCKMYKAAPQSPHVDTV